VELWTDGGSKYEDPVTSGRLINAALQFHLLLLSCCCVYAAEVKVHLTMQALTRQDNVFAVQLFLHAQLRSDYIYFFGRPYFVRSRLCHSMSSVVCRL